MKIYAKKILAVLLCVTIIISCSVIGVLAQSEPVAYTFDNLNNFVHKNSAKNNPVEADDGIKTASGGASKLQVLEEPITYIQKTFDDFYNAENYDTYGSKYTTKNFFFSFDQTNKKITTGDIQSKAKLEDTNSLTDFNATFTVTKVDNGNALYAGMAFHIDDSDFRSATFGTRGHMLILTSGYTSTDVKIILRNYNMASASVDIASATATELLADAKNGVSVTMEVKGDSISVTLADATDSSRTYTKTMSLRVSSTYYRESGSVALVSNGNHIFENISLSGKVATNYVDKAKEITNLYNPDYYTLYGDSDKENYGITFGKDYISTASQSKVKINHHSNIEDFDADFIIESTNTVSLYGGIGFHLQDVGFKGGTFGGPGYLLFARSKSDSMDLELVLRNYTTSTSYDYKVIANVEGFFAAPNVDGLKVSLSVRGKNADITVYDTTDLTRKYSTSFTLSSTNSKAGNYTGGSIAFVSNGFHKYSNIAIDYIENEEPYLYAKNFKAETTYKLINKSSQFGIMFGVQDTDYVSPGLNGLYFKAFPSTSTEKAFTLQLIRYGTTIAGKEYQNLSALYGATNQIANFLSTKYGENEEIKLHLSVMSGKVYYYAENITRGITSNVFECELSASSTASEIQYNSNYKEGGIGYFSVGTQVNPRGFKITPLPDINVTFGDFTGGIATGSGTYSYSETVTLKAMADYGYYFGGWYNGDTLISENEEYIFNTYSDICLTPKFIPFPLRYVSNDTENKAFVMTLDSIEGVTEIGCDITVKTEDGDKSYNISTDYVNESAFNKKPYIAVEDNVYYCDIDGDGEANAADLTTFMKKILNRETLNHRADITGDDKNDIRDLVGFKNVLAKTELVFDGECSQNYSYAFNIGVDLNKEGKQYIQIKPYSITNGKKAYTVPRYLSFDGYKLTRNSANENHTPFGKVRIACVGDSITQGVGASGWQSGDYTYAYPEQLGRLLSDTCTVGNFGRGSSYVYYRTGRTESLWYPNTIQYNSSNEFDADIVVIKLGTNDAREMKDEITSTAWKEQFTDLVKHYQNLESKPTVYIMTSITMANYTPSNSTKGAFEAGLVDYILPMQKAVAEELGCTLLDAYTDLYDIFISGEGFASDGLHPNDTGYAAMAEYVKANISTDIFF